MRRTIGPALLLCRAMCTGAATPASPWDVPFPSDVFTVADADKPLEDVLTLSVFTTRTMH